MYSLKSCIPAGIFPSNMAFPCNLVGQCTVLSNVLHAFYHSLVTNIPSITVGAKQRTNKQYDRLCVIHTLNYFVCLHQDCIFE